MDKRVLGQAGDETARAAVSLMLNKTLQILRRQADRRHAMRAVRAGR